MKSVFLVLLFLSDLFFQTIVKSKECDTVACKRASRSIIYNMNPDVNPCYDFYYYACGGFMEREQLLEEQKLLSHFTITNSAINEQLKGLFSNPLASDEPKYFNHTKALYDLCLKWESLKRDDAADIKNIFKQLGQWTALDGSKSTSKSFDWLNFTYTARGMGLAHNSILLVSIEKTLSNTSRLVISPGKINKIDRSEERVVQNFVKKLTDNKNNAKREIKSALKIGNCLKQLVSKKAKESIQTLEDMQNTYSEIPWETFLKNYIGFEPPTTIKVTDTDYLKNLPSCLIQKRDLANYLWVSVVLDFLSTLENDIKKLKFNTLNYNDAVKYLSRKETCIEIVQSKLPLITIAMYVIEYNIDEATVMKANNLVIDLKTAFKQLIADSKLDNDAKKAATDKVSEIRVALSYPPEIVNEKKMGNYFSKLNYKGNNFIEFCLDIKKLYVDKYYEEQQKPSGWTQAKNNIGIDAYYILKENRIEIPLGLMQYPFFDKNRTNYLNYGSLGFIIGHEMVHALGRPGIDYDKSGNRRDLWSQSAKNSYIKNLECLEKQYGDYPNRFNKKAKLNGKNTLEENLADTVGLKLAYMAYLSSTGKKGEEGLPNLNLSPKRLFWISAVNLWCTLTDDSVEEHLYNNGPHSPMRERVIGALSYNYNFFYPEYKCQRGSPLQPKNKCVIW